MKLVQSNVPHVDFNHHDQTVEKIFKHFKKQCRDFTRFERSIFIFTLFGLDSYFLLKTVTHQEETWPWICSTFVKQVCSLIFSTLEAVWISVWQEGVKKCLVKLLWVHLHDGGGETTTRRLKVLEWKQDTFIFLKHPQAEAKTLQFSI